MASMNKKVDELGKTVARIQTKVLAFVFALIAGLGIFFMTAWLLIKGGERVGAHLNLLGQYFIGYSVTWKGSIVGFCYGSFIGGIVGWAIGTIYNKIVYMRR